MLLLLAGLLFRVSAQTIDSEGVAYYKAGFPNAAKTLLLSEVGTSPSDARGYYYLGNIYFSENKADSASYYYKKGLALDAENPYCRIGLAQLLLKDDPKQGAEQIDAMLKGKNKKNPDIIIAAGSRFYKTDIHFRKTDARFPKTDVHFLMGCCKPMYRKKPVSYSTKKSSDLNSL